MPRSRSTTPTAVRSVTDTDGDTLQATRMADGSVYVKIATDGEDSFTAVYLTAAQWERVTSL